MKAAVLSILLLATFCLPASFADTTSAPSSPRANVIETHTETGFLQGIQLQFNQLQKQLKDRITRLARSLRQGDRSVSALLIGLAFLYGIIHAAGPGHGKAIIASYLLTQQVSLRRGVFIAILSALLHGGSAIVLVLLIYFFSLGRVSMTFNHWSASLQTLAYLLIILLGLFLVVLKVVHIAKKRAPSVAAEKPQRQPWWLFAALALVPCPGTMIVLLFFMSQKMLGFGILMAMLMALGMAVTLAGVGFGTVLTQSMFTNHNRPQRVALSAFLHDFIGLFGALSVLVIGLLLFSSV